MPMTLTMPKLSPTMEEGTIAKWHKKEGDQVAPGDVLMEVATDKATIEYEAVDEGVLRKILVHEGESARVNQGVAIFTADSQESLSGYEPEGLDLKVNEPAGEHAETSRQDVGKQGVAVKVEGAGVFIQPAFEPVAPLEGYTFSTATSLGKRVNASPLAKRLAESQRLDLSEVKGSGPGGRIVKRDLDKAPPASMLAFGGSQIPQLKPGTYEEESLSPMRKAIGRRLQQSKTFIPHFYVAQEINAGAMVEIRRQLQEYGVKLSYNDLIVRAAALALREKPALNSGYNSVSEKIVRFKTIDIAIAVSIDGGLITPIIRHADYKKVGELAAEVKALAKRAREGKLQPTEYQGGSFTISNLGMYGVTDFMAVINPPQCAILAVGGIRETPIIQAGQVIPGKLLNLSVACDHRVVDGADAAEFLNVMKRFLEHPAGLIV